MHLRPLVLDPLLALVCVVDKVELLCLPLADALCVCDWSAGVAGGNLIPLFLRYSSSDRHTNSERKCPHSLGLILEKMKSISDAVNEVGRTLTASTNRYTFGRLSEALLGGVSLSTGLGSYPMA